MPFIIICVISYIVLKFNEMLKIISAGYYDFYGCIEPACVGKLKLKFVTVSISVCVDKHDVYFGVTVSICLCVDKYEVYFGVTYPSISVWIDVRCIVVLHYPLVSVWLNVRCILVLL